MSDTSQSRFVIHVSLIDEFLAARLLEGHAGPLAFSVSGEGSDGNISLAAMDAPANAAPGVGIDFELSSCECRGLDTEDIAAYLDRPVYTSSAYEFFDFMLGYFSSFDCVIEFTGNAWSIGVVNAVRG